MLSLLAETGATAADAPPPKPEGKPAVVELFEDDADTLVKLLDNGGVAEPGQATREDNDRYTGSAALRVTPVQRYSPNIKGWNFPIVEKPQPGQYRYIRFAWKKIGGTGIMVQLCRENGGWEQRYTAGQPAQPWPAKKVNEKMPEKWEVVTRDLFQDFGAMTLMGMAFTPMDGTAGLFDHVYLGRSIEDLDKVTKAALEKEPNKEELSAEKLQELYQNLLSRDALISGPAAAMLAMGPKESVPYLRKQLETAPQSEDEKKLAQLIRDLDNDDFHVREAATSELKKMGPAATKALSKAIKDTTSVEVARRITAILGKDVSDPDGPTPESRQKIQAIRILERINTPEAREALQKIGEASLETGLGQEVKLALARMAKKAGG